MDEEVEHDRTGGCGLPVKASHCRSRANPGLRQQLTGCMDPVRPAGREIGAPAWELTGVGWRRELLGKEEGAEKALVVRGPLARGRLISRHNR